MNKPVDVLATMKRCVMGLEDKEGMRDLGLAIDAMAELIAASLRAENKLLHLCEHVLRGEICAETREDWRALFDALAKIGGAR